MDLALVSTSTGLMAIDVESGGIVYALNDSNASVVVPVGTSGQGGAAGTRLICAPQLPKGLLHYWRLNGGSGMPESSGNAVYKSSCPEKFSAIVFSSCGGLMFSGTHSGMLYCWQTYTGHLLRTWTAHFGSITKLLLTRDDSVLLSASEDSSVKSFFVPNIFDRAVVEPEHVYSGHSAKINDILIVKDSILVTASSDKTVKFFDLTGGSYDQRAHYPVTSGGEPLKLAATRTGDVFFGCSDGSIHLAGSEEIVFSGEHSGPVCGLGVTMDGSRLVSCCEADGVKIWDTRSLMQVGSVAQVKSPQGLLMLRKAASIPEQVDEDLNRRAAGQLKYVSGIDTHLQLKPLGRTVTRPETIDVIPLIRVPMTLGGPLPKVKNAILINRASVEEGAAGLDPLTKAQNEVVKQRELTRMWATAFSEAVGRLSTFTDGEVELALPVALSEPTTKKPRRK